MQAVTQCGQKLSQLILLLKGLTGGLDDTQIRLLEERP